MAPFNREEAATVSKDSLQGQNHTLHAGTAAPAQGFSNFVRQEQVGFFFKD